MLQIQNLESALASAGDAHAGLKTELEEKMREVTQMQNSAVKISEKLQQSSDSADQERYDVIRLEGTLAEKEKLLNEAQRKLKASLVSRKSLMTKVRELEARKEEVEVLNDSLMAEKSSLSSRLSDSLNSSKQMEEALLRSESSQSDAACLQDEIQRLQRDLDVTSRKSTDLEDACSGFEKTVKILEKKNSDFGAEMNLLKLANRELTETNAQLTSRNEENWENLKQSSDEIEGLITKLGELNAQFSDTKHELEEVQQRFVLKETEIKQLHNRVAEADAAKAVAVNELSQLKTKLELAENQSAAAANEALQLRTQLQVMQDEAKILVGKLNETRVALSENELQSMNELRLKSAELTETCDELRVKNDSLSQALKYQEAARTELEEKIKNLDSRTTELTEVLESTSQHNAKLQETLLSKNEEFLIKVNEINDLMSQIRTLQKLVEEKEMLMSDLSVENTQVLQQNKIQNETIAELNNKNKELVADIVSRNTNNDEENAQLLVEVERLNYSVAELEEKLKVSELNRSNESIQQEQLQHSAAASNDKLTQLQRKLKAALLSRKELIAETKQKGELIDAEKKKQRELVMEKEVLQQAMSDLKKSLSTANDRISKLETSSSDKQGLLNNLQNESETLKKQMRIAAEEKLELQKKAEELSMEVGTLQTCNKDMNEMVAAMETRSKKLEKSLTEKTESLRSAQKCIRKLENTLGQGESGTHSSSSLKKEINILQEKCNDLNARYDSLDAEKREKIQMLEQVTRDFERELIVKEDLANRCENLEKDLAMQKLEFDQATTQLAELQIQYDNLMKKHCVLQDNQMQNKMLSEIQENLRELSATNAGLESENKICKEEISELRSKVFYLENSVSTNQGVAKPVLIKESLLQANTSSDLQRDRRDLIKETLKQLKVTEPEKWQQEPGIKKLIDKLEETAEKASALEKVLSEHEDKLSNALEEIKNLKAEKINLIEKTEKGKVFEEKIKNVVKEHEKLKKKYEAVQKDCDHLNSALQIEKDSYEEWRQIAERERNVLKKKLEEAKKRENELLVELEHSSQTCGALSLQCADLQHAAAEVQAELDKSVSNTSALEEDFENYKKENSLLLDQAKTELLQTEESLAAKGIELKNLQEAHRALSVSA